MKPSLSSFLARAVAYCSFEVLFPSFTTYIGLQVKLVKHQPPIPILTTYKPYAPSTAHVVQTFGTQPALVIWGGSSAVGG